nr:MAG TPA: minor tail protein [Caudoviricetes sp.]
MATSIGGISFDLSFDGSKMLASINDACKKVKDRFNQSFSQAAKKSTEAIKTGNTEIDKILSQTARSAKSKAAAIASVYKKEGESASEAFRKAWLLIERDSESGSGEVKKHIKGIGSQFKKTSSEIEDDASSLKTRVSGIGTLTRKLGSLLVGAFAVKKLTDFGKSCLELGSDLAEVQNVVDVTFPNMTAQVDKFAKSAAQSFGLSETMAKRFTGTFGAMAKAFGFSESQAYEMGSSLTKLAGDVASFYNISQDEAYTKLKSVFTGETESLKDLGVVMTQTALDSYALANGFGKTTAKMSEAEKVALRYSFVQNQLAAAQGDFARTSGSWANQVRILALQFDSLKATIGQGLINLFTPVIKVINTVIGKLITLANDFKSFTELITGQKSSSASGQISAIGSAAAGASTGMDNAASSADNLSTANNGVAKSAQKAAEKMRALMGFDQINRLDSQTDSTSSTPSFGSGTGTGGVGGAGIDFGSLAQGETVVDKADKQFTKMFQNIKKLCDPATQSLKRLWNEGLARLGTFTFNSLKDFWKNFLVPVGKWTLGTGIPRFIDALNNGLMKVDFDKIRNSLNGLWKALTPFAIHVGEGLLWFWENVLVPFGTWTANELIPMFLDNLSTAISTFNSILIALQPLFQWFWDSVLQPIAQWTGGAFNAIWDKTNGLLKTFSDWCAANPGVIQTIATVIASFFAAWKISEFVTNAAGFITTIANIVSSIKSISGAVALVKTGVEALVGALGGPLVIGIAAAIAAGILLYKNWDTICEYAAKLRDWVVEKTTQLRDGAVKAFNTLSTSVKNAMKAIQNAVKDKLTAVKQKFNSLVEWLKDGFTESWKKVWNSCQKTASDFKEKAKTVFENVKTNILQPFSNFVKNIFKKDWSESFGVLGSVLNTFLKSVSGIWENIKDVFNGVITFINGAFAGDWRQAWGGIKGIFTGVFSGLSDLARTPVNSVISGFNGVLGTVNGLIGKINNIKFKITVPDWVPGIGGRWWGFNGFHIPNIGTIPMLANGGFVKANTPQLAMIGDNRHQGEVVSPEDKLQEMAVKAASMAAGKGVSKEELESIINRAVMRIIAALAEMGFYLDSTQVATAIKNAQAAMDIRYNAVEVV